MREKLKHSWNIEQNPVGEKKTQLEYLVEIWRRPWLEQEDN
jgi:hypothetical protein